MEIVKFIMSVIFTDIVYQIIKNDLSISLRKLFNKNCKVIVKFRGIIGIHNSPNINQIITIKNLGQDVVYVKRAFIKVCQKYNPGLDSYKIGKMKKYKNNLVADFSLTSKLPKKLNPGEYLIVDTDINSMAITMSQLLMNSYRIQLVITDNEGNEYKSKNLKKEMIKARNEIHLPSN